MGLFDQVLGVAASLANQQGNNANPLLAGVMQMLNDPRVGGVSGLLLAFQNGGLGNIVQSWISTGQNLPISAEQIQSVIGSGPLGALASQLGVSPEQASGQLAEYLPQVVDKLTPNGQVPEGGDLMAMGMELLKGKLLG